MDWVKIRTNIVDHERLLEAGAVARDLWSWGMLYAGKHESDGELPMAAVLASPWGAGGKSNIRPALKLVAVGLWERTDRGFRICRWAEQGNQTKAQIEAERAAARARKKKGSPELLPNERRTNAEVPTSISYSLSDSSGSRDCVSPPEWWEGTCGAVEMATGVTLNRAAAWLRYSGHRGDKGKAISKNDAQQFLVSVDAKELRQERERERATRDIAKQRDEARAPKPEPVWRPPADDANAATPEQHRQFAEELQRRLAGAGR